jgi:hypothetical protein
VAVRPHYLVGVAAGQPLFSWGGHTPTPPHLRLAVRPPSYFFNFLNNKSASTPEISFFL